MGELGSEGLEDSFEDHEEASSVLAAVDVDVGEVELQGLGSALDVGAESLGQNRLTGSNVACDEDFGASRPGLVNDRPKELGEES